MLNYLIKEEPQARGWQKERQHNRPEAGANTVGQKQKQKGDRSRRFAFDHADRIYADGNRNEKAVALAARSSVNVIVDLA